MAESNRTTQFDKALLGLRSLILNGEYAANSRLPETSLSERLGLSRTPLRQAMDALVNEGLLERNPTGGCRVASFSLEDIRDAIDLRGVVEGMAARLAAERGVSAARLANGQKILDKIDAALSCQPLDFESYVRHNAEFHTLLSTLAGSSLVTREVERVTRLPLASPSAFLQEQALIPDFQHSLVYAQRQHRAILDAITRREGSRAEWLAREHARLALQNFEYVTHAAPELAEKVPGMALVANHQ